MCKTQEVNEACKAQDAKKVTVYGKLLKFTRSTKSFAKKTQAVIVARERRSSYPLSCWEVMHRTLGL